MEKIWLKSYPSHVAPEISLDRYPSLLELLFEAFSTHADRPCFTSMGKVLTFREMQQEVEALATYFTEELGLKKGDRVGIMMPNILQNPISIFAALISGLTVVNINPLYTERELLHQLKDSGAETIVIVENFAHVLAAVQQQSPVRHVVVTSMGELLGGAKGHIVNFVVRKVKKMVPAYQLPNAVTFKKALELGRKHRYQRPTLSSKDLAFLQYTGGTTGVSKGAMLSHGNMVANVSQAYEWIKKDLEVGKDIIITALPLYHIFALTANCLTYMTVGAQNVLIANPRDLPTFVKTLQKYPFTAITGVNTLFNALLNNEQFRKIDFRPLKLTLGGGMAVQKPVADRWYDVTGCLLIQAYGLTETSPAACINPFDVKEFNGSIGLPLSNTEVSVRDDAGKELALEEVGELWIRGPQVMQGYWQQKSETEQVLTSDGWLRTGDMARIDSKGFIYLVDRKKDMILVSGFNVYPNEIEEVLASHPDIVEAAVVGVADEKTGEAVKAFLVKKRADLKPEEIIEFCRKDLTNYKIPKQIEFRDELPKTNVGKILRRALKE